MMLSDVMEDYLKGIYELQRHSDDRISTSEIADHLDVTQPTVSSMIEKLADRGLLDYQKYEGVTLTDEGETIAIEVIRHHRLLESYLTEHLDYDFSEVHDEADRLEHHISEKFEQRLAEQLDNPTTDPHGDPIPSEDLEPPAEPSAILLSTADAGMRATVVRINDDDAETLEYLSERGVKPNGELEIMDVAPFGMITVRTDDQQQISLPESIAKDVHIHPIDE